MSQLIMTIRGKPFLGVEKANKRSLIESAAFVSNQAKVLAPVDKGQLRNSIMYKTSEKSSGLNDSGGETVENGLKETPKGNEAVVGFNLKHGIYQEFGTRRLPARPFLRPAGRLLNISGLKKINKKEMKEALLKGIKRIRLSK